MTVEMEVAGLAEAAVGKAEEVMVAVAMVEEGVVEGLAGVGREAGAGTMAAVTVAVATPVAVSQAELMVVAAVAAVARAAEATEAVVMGAATAVEARAAVAMAEETVAMLASLARADRRKCR